MHSYFTKKLIENIEKSTPINYIIPSIFQVNELIDKGGNSTLHRGSLWGSEIAVKKINLEKITPYIIDSLINEIKILEAIQTNVLNNVLYSNLFCSYYGASNDKNSIYLLQQYINGKNLRKVNKFNEVQILKITYELINSLYFLNSKLKIIHRDIKPENILLDYDNNNMIKIIDFGISINLNESSFFDYKTRGSPKYMPPEGFNQIGIFEKYDVWSFGCLLCELVLQKKPWNGKNDQEIENELKYLKDYPFEEIVKKIFGVKIFKKDANDILFEIIQSCLIFDLVGRMDFKTIKNNFLRKLKDKILVLELGIKNEIEEFQIMSNYDYTLPNDEFNLNKENVEEEKTYEIVYNQSLNSKEEIEETKNLKMMEKLDININDETKEINHGFLPKNSNIEETYEIKPNKQVKKFRNGHDETKEINHDYLHINQGSGPVNGQSVSNELKDFYIKELDENKILIIFNKTIEPSKNFLRIEGNFIIPQQCEFVKIPNFNAGHFIKNSNNNYSYKSVSDLFLKNEIFLIGGKDLSGMVSKKIYKLYYIENKNRISLIELNQLSHRRKDFSSIYYNGLIYIIGGSIFNDLASEIEVYHISQNKLYSKYALNYPRICCSSQIVLNKYIYVFGGLDIYGKPVSSIERLSLMENNQKYLTIINPTFSEENFKNSGLNFNFTVKLNDDKILVLSHNSYVFYYDTNKNNFELVYQFREPINIDFTNQVAVIKGTIVYIDNNNNLNEVILDKNFSVHTTDLNIRKNQNHKKNYYRK